MRAIAIQVMGGHTWGPDLFQVDLQVTWVDPTGNGISGGGDMSVPITASAEAINDAIRVKGIQIAADRGFVLAVGGVVRIFGGAVPNVS